MSNDIGQVLDVRLALAKAQVHWLVATSEDRHIAAGDSLEYVSTKRDLLQAAALAWPDVPATVVWDLAVEHGPNGIEYGIRQWREAMNRVAIDATHKPDDAPKPSDWEIKHYEGWWKSAAIRV